MPCGGSHADPFELALERLAALALLLFLQSQPLRLLLEPAAVVAFPRNAFAPVEFEYPSGHVVEEVTVVRDGDHRSLVLSQVLLEPVDALGVEMVRRLVQQQHVGLLQQEPAQRHAATLAAREVLHRLVGVGTAQCVHRPFERRIELPAVFVIDLLGQLALSLDQLGHLLVVHRLHETGVDLLVLLEQRDHVGAAFLDHLADRLRVVQMRFLLEIADRVSGRKDDFALKVLVYSGDDFHQRRLARPVQADDADLRAVEKRQVNVVQYLFWVRESLADPHHREYDFFIVCHIKKIELKSKTYFFKGVAFTR